MYQGKHLIKIYSFIPSFVCLSVYLYVLVYRLLSLSINCQESLVAVHYDDELT